MDGYKFVTDRLPARQRENGEARIRARRPVPSELNIVRDRPYTGRRQNVWKEFCNIPAHINLLDTNDPHRQTGLTGRPAVRS